MRAYKLTDGTHVGTQAEIVGDFEQVEVPTDKEGLLKYINNLQLTSTPEPESEPEPTPMGWLSEWQAEKAGQDEELNLNVELDEALLRAPLDTCLRLLSLVAERTREHLSKEK